MQRRINYTLFFFLVLLFACDTKADFEGEFQNYFIKYYGEDGDQLAVDFHINQDGSIVILGSTEQVVGSKKILLMKTDPNGAVLWQIKFGGGDGVLTELPQDIEQLPNGHYIVLSNILLGVDPVTNENIFDFKVVHIDPNGNRVDSLVYGNNNGRWSTQFANSITPLSTGGFTVVGNSTDENISRDPEGYATPDIEDLFAIGFGPPPTYTIDWKLINDGSDAKGDETGTPGEQSGMAVKLFEVSAGQYHLFAYSDHVESAIDIGTSNFNAFQLNSFGNINGVAGMAGVGSGRHEVLNAVCAIPSGGYFEVGTSKTSLSDASGSLYFCRKISGLNSSQKEGLISGISGSKRAVDVFPSLFNDTFLLLADEVTSSGSSILLSRVSDSGSAFWAIQLGSTLGHNEGKRVAELLDGRILILATVELATQKKIALLKVNSNGEFLN